MQFKHCHFLDYLLKKNQIFKNIKKIALTNFYKYMAELFGFLNYDTQQ